MQDRTWSRRTFLATAGAGAVGAMVSGCVTGRRGPAFSKVPARTGRILPQGRKLNIACIGCGGQGNTDVGSVASENIVALCDVDAERAKGMFDRFPKAKLYKDYRHMLLEMDKQIDAVTVSTPDHTHFPAAMMAMTMGKHVFVQKPIAHTVEEARLLTLAARKHEVMTVMGNQGHANNGTRLVYEWVRSGAIGAVREVHVWTNRPVWPQGLQRPLEVMVPPKTLDWNRWLGVAPVRPYNSCYLPFNWRGWWDFGCGAMGDMGCHMLDAAFWALDLGYPISLEAECDTITEETAPKQATVTFQFPARGDMPPVKLVWYEGGRKPPRPKDLEDERKVPDTGQLIIGDKGTIMDGSDYCASPRIIPETRMREVGRPPEMVPRIPGANHYQEWINSCKGGPKAGSNFDHAGPLTEMVLLGNLAMRVNGRMEWDGQTMTCTNIPEANAFVRKQYRVF